MTATPHAPAVLIDLDALTQRDEILAYAQQRGIGWREAITALARTHVWTLHAEAKGPESGDWDGTDSVHATRKGAESTVFNFVHGLGVDPRDPAATLITAEHEDDHQTCIEFETINGWQGHYGIHRAEVKA